MRACVYNLTATATGERASKTAGERAEEAL